MPVDSKGRHPRRSTLACGVVTAIVFLAGCGAWMIAAAAGILNTTSRVWAYCIANGVLLLDMVDLVTRVWVIQRSPSGAGPSVDLCIPEIAATEAAALLRPYAILVPVHDASDTIDRFVDIMEPFKDRVWLVDDASNDDTLPRLRRVGWNCIDGAPHRNRSAALYHLIKLLPPEIETVLVIDPQVTWNGNAALRRETLDRVVSDLQRSGAAAASPRMSAHEPGWLMECQAFERELSGGLVGRSLGNLCTNSGASLYRRSALEAALTLHSLSEYGANLENTLLLLAAGERIYYDDRLAFGYHVKRTWSGWFVQRIARSFGGAKVLMERVPLLMAISRRSVFGAYHYVFCLGIGGYLLLPLRLASLGILAASLSNGLGDLSALELVPEHSWNDPVLFALWYANTVVLLFIAWFAALPRDERLRHLPTIVFYPFYTLLQPLPAVLGVANLLALRIVGQCIFIRSGRNRDVNPKPDTLPPLSRDRELIA